MKVIIIGGVAGGASGVARLRRLDEKAEIIMVERGPYVSFSNSVQRAHYATRILLQNGFKASNLAGGMLTRAMNSIVTPRS